MLLYLTELVQGIPKNIYKDINIACSRDEEILLDCTGAQLVLSTLIGVIVGLKKVIQSQNGLTRFRVIEVEENLFDTLEVCGLTSVLIIEKVAKKQKFTQKNN